MAELEKIRYFSVKSNVTGNQDNTGASGVNAIAIGPNASTITEASITMGLNANASDRGKNAVAIGTDAKTTAENGVSLGHKANSEYQTLRQLVIQAMQMVVMLRLLVLMLKRLLIRQH